MVRGLDVFRDWFSDYSDRYILIGGTAAHIAMAEAGAEFRATKDLDIVLVAEELDAAFVTAIRDFTEAGRYHKRMKSSGKTCLYRFSHPEDENYPFMLEFFSLLPNDIQFEGEGHLAPIPTDEVGVSLSAILLDPDYYEFIVAGRYEIDGLTLLRQEYMIPLKARAFLDLAAQRKRGESVQSNDIRKHISDVFRLFRIVDPDQRPYLPAGIEEDLAKFLSAAQEAGFDPRRSGYRDRSLADLCTDIRKHYGLPGSTTVP
ncbi:MAG: hypothetical protein KFH87_12375 [Bacteroidetes bacterium]|nr:hypothetical protein [Bacteroidota bacterium]